jgi:hypothetical protein
MVVRYRGRRPQQQAQSRVPKKHLRCTYAGHTALPRLCQPGRHHQVCVLSGERRTLSERYEAHARSALLDSIRYEESDSPGLEGRSTFQVGLWRGKCLIDPHNAPLLILLDRLGTGTATTVISSTAGTTTRR